MSVSVPFNTPSSQLGGTHWFSSQTPEIQSVGTSQFPGAAQAGQSGPPQSTSVSFPLGAPSWQVGAAQVLVASSQTSETQSSASPQPSSVSHVEPHSPPQSSSVSEPFWVPSVHEGGWQTSIRQTVEVQSVVSRHESPSSHGPQVSPPQSTSDSLPLWMPSRQVAAVHEPSPQASDRQSSPSSQPSPSSHGPHEGPPQSTSVSPWS